MKFKNKKIAKVIYEGLKQNSPELPCHLRCILGEIAAIYDRRSGSSDLFHIFVTIMIESQAKIALAAADLLAHFKDGDFEILDVDTISRIGALFKTIIEGRKIEIEVIP